ncbi:hypothetical protein IVG45_10280 [Methylomonas sp. LL1]|uniref:hypothetical protein n=1 Tax=Methylomonas sp. LL1 TaxID=2785785 RepID=UPI0018C36DC5|nr:hypothetical protein [Methylomonas sp. LL1]QPK65278.1 hypothetical protein IVG45_10280 [Methylomonas sp. LL1]
MKERITMLRLMQQGWIPVLTGTVSAGVILSLANSAGMAYVTALLLMTLYFVAIAANRIDARAVVTVAAERILRRVIQKIRDFLVIEALADGGGNTQSPCVPPLDWVKNQAGQSISALPENVARLARWLESRLSAVIGSASALDGRNLIEGFNNSKIVLGKFLQSIKSVV